MADSTKANYADQEDALRRQLEAAIEAELKLFFESVLEHSYKYSAAGSYFAQFHKALARIDRFGNRTITQNHEYSGLVFFTRPTINFTEANLRQHRILNMLETLDPQSTQFMIRMLLDSDLSQTPYFQDLVGRSPLIDGNSPFITPLSNCCDTLGGAPNLTMETYTTEGGLFSEAQSMPVGSDRSAKPIDLSLSFTDIQGGICHAILMYWFLYMDLLQRGEVVQYTRDFEQRRMGWTSSIYRFMLDPSRQYITKWCKFTGCFPTSFPSASVLDYNSAEGFVEAAKKINVTFKCNHVGYPQDPVILKEFNMLVKKFCGSIDTSAYVRLTTNPEHNYVGLPYITTTQYGPRLDFYAPKYELEDTVIQDLEQASENIAQKKLEYEARIKALRAQYSNQQNQTSSDPNIVYV